MDDIENNEFLKKLIVELKNAQPFLQQILMRNVAGGLLPENAIRNLLVALKEYESNKGNDL